MTVTNLKPIVKCIRKDHLSLKVFIMCRHFSQWPILKKICSFHIQTPIKNEILNYLLAQKFFSQCCDYEKERANTLLFSRPFIDMIFHKNEILNYLLVQKILSQCCEYEKERANTLLFSRPLIEKKIQYA